MFEIMKFVFLFNKVSCARAILQVSVPDPKSRSCLCSVVLIVALICAVYFTGSAMMAKDSRAFSGFTVNRAKQNGQCGKCEVSPPRQEKQESRVTENVHDNKCQKKCRPFGSEALPEGIVSKTSNFEMRPLWGDVEKKSPHSVNLLGIAVGIKQKELVNKIVKKFLEHDFVVMLFHYDGVVDEWNDLDWSSRAIHISAMNQTKWWFAKRFLHPDIVSEYDYIFLWDEDLGVENFHPDKYISIVREEGLEISQPALDARKSEVHHHITVRRGRSKVHRRFYRLHKRGQTCDNNSTEPPCVGWVEMMAPVFSKAAWRCAWYMVQNDLIHAWGLDMKLGYCAQANLNNFLPTFRLFLVIKELDHSLQGKNFSDSDALAAPVEKFDNRSLRPKLELCIERRYAGLGTDTGLSNLEKLDLTSNGFNSTIFSSLKHFPSLKHLDLKNNDIVGNIEMSDIIALSNLNLRMNNFESFVTTKSDLSASATAYGKVNSNSKFLYLSTITNVARTLKESLRNMSTLEYLNLDGSYLNENFLSSIGQMTSLKVLNMAFGGNYGILPNQGWCELQNIQELSFMNNNFEGTLPSCLGNLTSLRWLSLEGNRFSGNIASGGDSHHSSPIPSDIGGFHLLALDLSHNFLSGGVPRDLAIGSPALFYLRLSNNKLTGQIFSKDVRPTIISLERFLVDGCGNTDPVYDKEKTLTYKGSILKYMTGIDLSSNRLAGEIPIEQNTCLELIAQPFCQKNPSLAIFSVAYNNLSGAVPPSKAQFSTFDKRSYEGNPLLCAYPLDNECSSTKSSDTSNDGSGDSTGFVDPESFYIRSSFASCSFSTERPDPCMGLGYEAWLSK
ncbi:hypothetical protein BC332_22113 [Capsicum chinense]|nr:hypothetical protein BC332_22113 [Capsicum chinense]